MLALCGVPEVRVPPRRLAEAAGTVTGEAVVGAARGQLLKPELRMGKDTGFGVRKAEELG